MNTGKYIYRSESLTNINNNEFYGKKETERQKLGHKQTRMYYSPPNSSRKIKGNSQDPRKNLYFLERVQRFEEASKTKVSYKQEEYTFCPNVNPRSKKLLKHSSFHSKLFSKETDFVSRQEMLNQREKMKLELLKEKEKENIDNQNLTFKPNINKTSQIIVESKNICEKETEKERIERLSKKDKHKKEVLQNLIQEQYYSQFKFQPELNPISKSIGQPSNVADSQLHEKLKQRRLDQLNEHPTNFKPVLVSRSLDVSSKVLDTSYELQKKKKLILAQRMQEYKSMKDCTFKPNIIKRMPFKTKPDSVVIKGLGQYLERKDIAKRLEEEKRLAQEEAFKVKSQNNSHIML